MQGRQGQDDGYTIDVNYGTSTIEAENPEFRVTRTQGRLFVQAWHSSGAFWRKENPTPADMIYAGLNPSDMLIQRSPSQKEEDAFAERLRLIGAQDWEDEERCEEEYYNEGVESGQRKYRQSSYGWPCNGKGLWVYEYNALSDRVSCWMLCVMSMIWMSNVLSWKNGRRRSMRIRATIPLLLRFSRFKKGVNLKRRNCDYDFTVPDS